MRRRRTTVHNNNPPWPLSGCLQVLPLFTLPSCDTWDGCVWLLGLGGIWSGAGNRPSNIPSSPSAGVSCVEGAHRLWLCHAGKRPAFFPLGPHPSHSTPLLRHRLPSPEVTWPQLVVACFFFREACSCPTALGLSPPPSQPPGPTTRPRKESPVPWPTGPGKDNGCFGEHAVEWD